MIRRAAASASLFLALSTGGAQAFTSIEEARIARLCAATARLAPSPLGIAIAAQAAREHQAFGGHVVARDGRMIRFGATEAEAFRGDQGGREPAWRRVLSYWLSLGAIEASGLVVTRLPGLVEDEAAREPDDPRPLGDLMARLRNAGLPAVEREALEQAAIRAGLMDVPWSAAFVSHVVIGAGVSASRFRASFAHVDYVTQAAAASLDAANDRPASTFYRACDPRRVAARPGDLVCTHRHGAIEPPRGSSLFATLAGALARGERPVWNLHCDIVVGRDDRRRTLSIIGGNVLQSATLRALPTDRRGAIARGARQPACPAPGMVGPLCHPEAAPWFVLMQAVDGE